MVWFAHDLTAYAMLVPAAIAGMLLPYTWWPQGDVRWHAQGNVAGAALSAAALAQLGAGTAFLPALWSLAALPPAFLLPRVSHLCPSAMPASKHWLIPAMWFLPKQCSDCIIDM